MMASTFAERKNATSKTHWSLPPDKVIVTENHARAPFGYREDLLQELMSTIPTLGQLEPGVCRKRNDGQVEVIEGRHRLEAVRRLRESGFPNLEFIFILEHNVGDAKAFTESVIANIQRTDSNPMDFAYQIDHFVRVYKMEYDVLISEVYTGPKWNKAKLQLYHSLLKLPRDIQQMVSTGEVGVSFAFQMARMSSEEAMRKALKQIPGESIAEPETEPLPEPNPEPQEPVLGQPETPKPKKRGRKPKASKPKPSKKPKSVSRDSMRAALHADGKKMPRTAADLKKFLTGRNDKLAVAIRDYLNDENGMDDDALDPIWNEVIYGVVAEDSMQEVENS